MKSIMLIGAMKCGTTTLYNHLIKHPEICGGVSKEPEYFSKKMGFPKYKQGRYEDLFETDAEAHKITLDASTGYTKYPAEKGVAERMEAYGLDPYFIYIVRNPLDRIKSHYNFMKGDVNWQGKLSSPHLVHLSMYNMQLEEYAKVFSKERILVVDFDDLKRNPEELCKRIFVFVEAAPFSFPAEEDSVRNKTVPDNKSQKLIKSRLNGYGRFFPGFVRKGFNRALKIFFPAKETVLSDGQKAEFREQLKDDMRALEENYSVEVGKWGF